MCKYDAPPLTPSSIKTSAAHQSRVNTSLLMRMLRRGDGNTSDSSSSSSSNEDSNSNSNRSSPDDQRQKASSTTTTTSATTQQKTPRRTFHRSSSSVVEAGWHITCGTIVSAVTVVFSLWLPFVLAPWAARETYHAAFYEYDNDISHFDNSFATYASDYVLAFAMFVVARSITMAHTPSQSHAYRSRGLLAMYMFSVLSGGIAHQFYTTHESRNTESFRFLWTVCVGTVSAASGFMGSIGSELVKIDRDTDQSRLASFIPLIPEWFWTGFAICTTVICAAGGFSYQRPACDIFIAGITQFPSTFYLMTIFACGLSQKPVANWARVMGVAAFGLNAPLLPMYPLLVQYTNLSLAAVNTILHTWLLVAWGMQGLALRHVGKAIIVQKDGKQQ